MKKGILLISLLVLAIVVSGCLQQPNSNTEEIERLKNQINSLQTQINELNMDVATKSSVTYVEGALLETQGRVSKLTGQVGYLLTKEFLRCENEITQQMVQREGFSSIDAYCKYLVYGEK